MTLLDTIHTLSTGPLGWGTLVAALAALLRILPGAIDRISKALAKAWERRADADADRAAAERTEAEAFTAMLSRYETRLTEAEAEAREARATIVRMQSRLDAQAAEIAALHRAVRRLGGTPTGLHAAATKPGAKE